MIYFVRHGETSDNINVVLTGHNDVSLTEKGLVQAEEVAYELKDIDFDVCYCSPLIRTRQTLEKFLQYKPNLQVIFDKRIIERDYGEVSGEHTSVCGFNRWHRDAKIPFKNFEAVDEVYLRAKSFYDEVRTKHRDQRVLVVSHSGFGRVSTCYFNGFPADGDLDKIKISNAKALMFDFNSSVEAKMKK